MSDLADSLHQFGSTQGFWKSVFNDLWYSRLPIIRTFKGNRKKFELSGVRVVEGKII